MHEVNQEAQVSQEIDRDTPQHPPTMLTIDGTLTEGRTLSRPLTVMVEYDDGEFLVSEPYFSIHGSGSTLAEAVAEFKRIFLEELDELTSDEENLGPRLKAELYYLRSAVRMA